MPRIRRGIAAALLVVASGAAAHAGATRLEAIPSLTLRGGADTNLYLDAHLTGPGDSAPASDVILDVVPRLRLALEHGRLRLVARYDLLDRNALTLGSVLLDQLASLSVEVRVGPLRITLTLHGERYDPVCGAADVACHPEDSFQRLGGELGLRGQRRTPRITVAAGASYRFDARYYPARPTQIDREHRAAAFLTLSHPGDVVGGEAHALFLHVDSLSPGANLDRLRGALVLFARPHPLLLLDGGYALSWQALPTASDGNGGAAPRRDLLHEAWLDVAVRPWRPLELFARADLLVATSDLPTGRYTRLQVVAGLTIAFDLTTTLPRPRAELVPLVDGGDVTFSARTAAPAARVAIVGDWNDWSPDSCVLAPVAGRANLFRARCPVPRGEHRYALWVDGAVSPPPDATRYAADSFGGTNGVLLVP